jgi:glutamate synthase (NADPH/NADH) small chain
MGNPKAFLTIPRQEAGYRPVHERISDFSEVEQVLNTSERRKQASRCMDCGVPFCHWACPVGNKQPEWQDLLYKGRWKEAWQILEQTCDFPEFTGRICPALCEKSCVLNLSIHEPVTIRENEVAIAEAAFREGYVRPVKPRARNGRKVAIVGSGPAGLAAANQLNRRGYEVTVFEKDELPGGLLRFGIPNFKLNKRIIDRRIELMKKEGVKFKTSTPIGANITTLTEEFDAVCLAIGSEVPRDLPVPGRNLKGIHFAMEYLGQQNRMLEGLAVAADRDVISARGRKVLVIGGGDTGSDCVGTANRQGAKSVTQIEILPQPPAGLNPATPWPAWPQILKTSSSHEEGCTRRWNLATSLFIGDSKGNLKSVETETVEWTQPSAGQPPEMKRTGKTEKIDADLVFLSMGFVNPVPDGILNELSLNTDARGNISVNSRQQTSFDRVFACGDAVSGASLVVRAMASGRQAADGIDRFLQRTKTPHGEPG